MSSSVFVAARADASIRSIRAWWQENRTAAPTLFDEELGRAIELLTRVPSVGERWPSQRILNVRRWLLPQSRYHVYYSVDGVHCHDPRSSLGRTWQWTATLEEAAPIRITLAPTSSLRAV